MTVDSIVFFRTKQAALDLCERGEMTEAEGFIVVEAIGRPGWFAIEVHDPEDGLLLGYL